ncbi:hypothetical protein FH972_011553 [Carpinus fangiana]|uniref:Legume lectin domain-containing protein n=1 Tax=Carpinus fangiana TaxID=176857 RepID=A0A660KTH7_9ROSI|nr:hypothetical protein FH972_011553 [Carpinus fangiana]
MYVGFSAATSILASYHHILGWSFNKSGPAQSLNVSSLPSLPQLRKMKEKPSLVIITCLMAVVPAQGLPDGVIVVDLASQCWRRGAILDASDPRLEGDYASDYVVEEMELVLKLGLLCSHAIPSARPSMKQVMQVLDGDANLRKL